MALTLYPGTDNYATVTVSGLYDNNTESPLFQAAGGTAPTSGLQVGGTCAQGNFEPLQLDQSFNLLAFPGIQFKAGTAWNSGTSAGTFQYNTGTATEGALQGAPAYLIQLDQTSTITAGAVTFQGTYDNVNWVTIPTAQVLNPNTFAQLTNPYTFVANTNQAFLILSQGYAAIRLDLSTAITGTGSVTPYWSTLPYEPSIQTTTSSTVSGTLSNNNAAPTSNNLGVLPALAATSYTTNTYTNGNQVLLVTDLHGAINSDLQAVAGVALASTGVQSFGASGANAPTGSVPGVNASIYQGGAAITQTNTLYDQISDGTNVMGTMANFGTSPGAVKALNTNSSLFAGTTALTATGTSLNVNVTGTATIAGNLTNNNAAPAANNLGVLGYLANGATVGTAPTPKTYTNGFQDLGTITTGGSQIVIPVDEYYASSISYFGYDSGVTATNPTGLTPIISIRTNSASFNFLIRSIQGATNGALGVFRLFKNPTLTGSTFAITPTNSHVQIDTAATAYSATGTQIWSGYSATGSIPFQQMLQYMAAGAPGDTFSIGWLKVGTGTANPYAALSWSEEAVVL
jgi:hypothetical protein